MKKQDFINTAIDAVENYLQRLGISETVTIDGYTERNDADGKKHPVLILDSDDGILSKTVDVYEDFKRSKAYDDAEVDRALRDSDPEEFPGLAEIMHAAQVYSDRDDVQIDNDYDDSYEDDYDDEIDSPTGTEGTEEYGPDEVDPSELTAADMRFDEFCEHVLGMVRTFLPEEYADADISLVERTRNNDTHSKGIMIRKNGETTTPTLYLEDYYEASLRTGETLSSICSMIASARVSSDLQIDASTVRDFESSRSSIVCRLLNRESNAEYLADKVTTDFADLAVAYSVNVGSHPQGGALSAPITNSILEMWGVSVEDVHTSAIENLEAAPHSILSMKDQLREMGAPDYIVDEIPEEPKQFVISNPEKINGAAELLNPSAMEYLSEQLGGDFVIIPSSVHECIALPVDENYSRETFERMITEVNSSEVPPEQILSTHLYAYDSTEREVVLASVLEERWESRGTGIDQQDHEVPEDDDIPF